MTRLFAAQFTVLSLLLSQTGGANAIGGYGGGNCEVAEARLEALEVAVKKISDHLEINVHDEFRQVKEAVMMTVEEVHVVNEEVGGEVSEVKEAVDAIKTLVEAIATKANAIEVKVDGLATKAALSEIRAVVDATATDVSQIKATVGDTAQISQIKTLVDDIAARMPTGPTTVVAVGQEGAWFGGYSSYKAIVAQDTCPYVTDVFVAVEIYPANGLSSDLEFVLTSPSGVSVVLHQNTGNIVGSFGSNNLGSLVAVGDMNDFLLNKGEGTWELYIGNRDGSDKGHEGKIENWSVRLTCAMKVDDVPATTTISILNASISELAATIDDTNTRALLLPNVEPDYMPSINGDGVGLCKGVGLADVTPTSISWIDFILTGSCFPFAKRLTDESPSSSGPVDGYSRAHYHLKDVADCIDVACGEYCEGGTCPGTSRSQEYQDNADFNNHGVPGTNTCQGDLEMYYKKCTYGHKRTYAMIG